MTNHSSFSIIDADNEQCKCTVFITIDTIDYGNNNYFYKIAYTYQYSTDNSNYLNPFYKCDDGEEGVIVNKNKLTDTLIEFLIMNDDDLKLLSGHISPFDYKAATMRSLALLWD
jgi:hypothetical protein